MDDYNYSQVRENNLRNKGLQVSNSLMCIESFKWISISSTFLLGSDYKHITFDMSLQVNPCLQYLQFRNLFKNVSQFSYGTQQEYLMLMLTAKYDHFEFAFFITSQLPPQFYSTQLPNSLDFNPQSNLMLVGFLTLNYELIKEI